MKKMTEQEYKKWMYERAGQVKTKMDLNTLIDTILDYKHDYGSIVYGCFAAMKGAFNIINRSDSGGITGFQASCLGWEAVAEFFHCTGSARLLDFDNMLWPKNDHKFAKTLDKSAWEDLQKKAKGMLKEMTDVDPEVTSHWESMVGGLIPYGYEIVEDD